MLLLYSRCSLIKDSLIIVYGCHVCAHWSTFIITVLWDCGFVTSDLQTLFANEADNMYLDFSQFLAIVLSYCLTLL